MGFGGQFSDVPQAPLLPNGLNAASVVYGLAANRPPACYRNYGLVYVATDTGAAWLSIGSAWVSIGSAGAVTSVTASAPIASSGGTTPNITHNTSGATAGSYTNANITIDAYGHVTVASNGSTGFTNPMTTLGDIIYENATPAAARLAGNTTTTKQFLTQTGTGTVSAAPAWATIAAADMPVFVASGLSHAPGAVPDPGATAGTTRFLREDATWAVPPAGSGQGVVGVNTQTGLSYTVGVNDNGKLITLNNASAVTVNVPIFSAGFWCAFENLGAGTVTVIGAACTIDGAPGLGITQNQGFFLFSDGTNYETCRGRGFSNPMTTLGDLIYEDGTPTAVRLAGNTSTTKQFLTQTGTGAVSAAPAWGGITQADLPAPVAPVVNWQAALMHI